MIPTEIIAKQKEIDALCIKYQVEELSLFGSFVRGEENQNSDIDILVVFKPESSIGLFEYFDLQEELETLLERKVDLVPKGGLKPRLKQQVLKEAEVFYNVAA